MAFCTTFRPTDDDDDANTRWSVISVCYLAQPATTRPTRLDQQPSVRLRSLKQQFYLGLWRNTTCFCGRSHKRRRAVSFQFVLDPWRVRASTFPNGGGREGAKRKVYYRACNIPRVWIRSARSNPGAKL